VPGESLRHFSPFGSIILHEFRTVFVTENRSDNRFGASAGPMRQKPAHGADASDNALRHIGRLEGDQFGLRAHIHLSGTPRIKSSRVFIAHQLSEISRDESARRREAENVATLTWFGRAEELKRAADRCDWFPDGGKPNVGPTSAFVHTMLIAMSIESLLN
jgi:hypothetical protein